MSDLEDTAAAGVDATIHEEESDRSIQHAYEDDGSSRGGAPTQPEARNSNTPPPQNNPTVGTSIKQNGIEGTTLVIPRNNTPRNNNPRPRSRSPTPRARNHSTPSDASSVGATSNVDSLIQMTLLQMQEDREARRNEIEEQRRREERMERVRAEDRRQRENEARESRQFMQAMMMAMIGGGNGFMNRMPFQGAASGMNNPRGGVDSNHFDINDNDEQP